MPNDYTSVPHYQQNSPGSALLACVRMISATWGHQLTEAEIGHVLGGAAFGTPAGHLTRLKRLGYQVSLSTATVSELAGQLTKGRYPVLFLDAAQLPWHGRPGLHAVVLVGQGDAELWLNDPAEQAGATPISHEALLAAWRSFGCQAAIISK